MGILVLISTPKSVMHIMSKSTNFLGRRYFGIHRLSIPPGEDNASKIVTPYPFLAKSWAAESPAGPEPIMATLFWSGRETGFFLFFLVS